MSPRNDPLPAGLYVVATPIGNLGDISQRAIDTLRGCALIACEDTRVTATLARRFALTAPLTPYHEHNADAARPGLITRAREAAVALVSDAGTPLISDPGYRLVAECRAQGIPVLPIPGACAAIAALSVAGLATDRFLFAGFLPSKSSARRTMLRELASIKATLVFYESPARLAESLRDMAEYLGDRQASIARELTKLHESHYAGSLSQLAGQFASQEVRGELVVCVAPPMPEAPAESVDVDALLREALTGASLKQAVADVTARTGLPRKQVYARALALGGHGAA
jgi:16S rRNA (cytidine1402-2'-O)-methyltransferase